MSAEDFYQELLDEKKTLLRPALLRHIKHKLIAMQGEYVAADFKNNNKIARKFVANLIALCKEYPDVGIVIHIQEKITNLSLKDEFVVTQANRSVVYCTELNKKKIPENLFVVAHIL